MSYLYKDDTRPSEIIQGNIDVIELELGNLSNQLEQFELQSKYVAIDHEINTNIRTIKRQIQELTKEHLDLKGHKLIWDTIEHDGRGLDIED